MIDRGAEEQGYMGREQDDTCGGMQFKANIPPNMLET
jgi:hypothetical protein